MFVIYLLIIFLLGVIAPVQTSSNTKAQDYLKSPLVASMFSFLLGTAALLVLCPLIEGGMPFSADNLSGLPWWAWLGGAAGVFGITTNILLFPRLGSMQTVLMPMVGQIICGFLIDSFGLFDSPVYPISLLRVVGFVLVMVGVFNVVSHDGKHFRDWKTLKWQLLGNLAGAVLAMQPAMNSRLALGIDSSLYASLYSFATGALLLLLICLALNGHRENLPKMFTARRPLWVWLGGLLGVCIVVGQTYLVDHVGVGLLTIINIFGMLVMSVIIDNFGILGANKISITRKKAIGLFLVLLGIVLLNL